MEKSSWGVNLGIRVGWETEREQVKEQVLLLMGDRKGTSEGTSVIVKRF